MTQRGHWAGVRDVAAAVVAAALGGVLAVYASLLSPTGPRVGASQPLGLGVLVGLVGVPVAVWLALTATGRRLVGAAPVVAWTVLVLVLGMRTSEGSVVLAGGPFQVSTTVVSFVGLIAGLVALTVLPTLRRRPSRRPRRP